MRESLHSASFFLPAGAKQAPGPLSDQSPFMFQLAGVPELRPGGEPSTPQLVILLTPSLPQALEAGVQLPLLLRATALQRSLSSLGFILLLELREDLPQAPFIPGRLSVCGEGSGPLLGGKTAVPEQALVQPEYFSLGSADWKKVPVSFLWSPPPSCPPSFSPFHFVSLPPDRACLRGKKEVAYCGSWRGCLPGNAPAPAACSPLRLHQETETCASLRATECISFAVY